MKSCPSCGRVLPADARFCADCGIAFDGPTAKKASPEKAFSFFASLTLLALTLAFLALTVFLFLGQPEEEVLFHSSAEDMAVLPLTVNGYNKEGKFLGSGIGFCVHEKGVLLTTDQLLVNQPDRLEIITPQGNILDIDAVMGCDEERKLLLLCFDSAYSPEPVPLADAPLKPGDLAAAIGTKVVTVTVPSICSDGTLLLSSEAGSETGSLLLNGRNEAAGFILSADGETFYAVSSEAILSFYEGHQHNRSSLTSYYKTLTDDFPAKNDLTAILDDIASR